MDYSRFTALVNRHRLVFVVVVAIAAVLCACLRVPVCVRVCVFVRYDMVLI